MHSFPANEIQKSIYEALTGDVTLMGRVTGVFDYVPQGQGFDYVTIGDDDISPQDSHTAAGVVAECRVHAWTRGHGRKKAKAVMTDVYRILHNANLSVDGFNLVRCQFNGAVQPDIDPDGQTYHGVMRFEVQVTN